MSRRWSGLCCGLVALGAWTAACAAGADAKYVPPATHLQGIKQALGLLLGLASLVSLGLGSVALILVATAVSPLRVARAEQALRRGRWVAVALGIVSAGVLLLLASILGALAAGTGGVGGVLALAVLGFLLWLAVVGVAGMAWIVGERLLGQAAAEASAWRVAGTGALVLAGALLIPIFGWAFYLYVLCRGIGAGTLSLFSGGGAPATHTHTDDDAS